MHFELHFETYRPPYKKKKIKAPLDFQLVLYIPFVHDVRF